MFLNYCMYWVSSRNNIVYGKALRKLVHAVKGLNGLNERIISAEVSAECKLSCMITVQIKLEWVVVIYIIGHVNYTCDGQSSVKLT